MEKEWRSHPWEIRCLNSIGSQCLRLPVVLVVCGGTRSVARELGGLGSSSDWASVLLWLWTPCSVPSPWASTDLLLVSVDFTHCGFLIYGIEHYAAFCAVFFCMTNVFRVYSCCGMNLHFAPFYGWIVSHCVLQHTSFARQLVDIWIINAFLAIMNDSLDVFCKSFCRHIISPKSFCRHIISPIPMELHC